MPDVSSGTTSVDKSSMSCVSSLMTHVRNTNIEQVKLILQQSQLLSRKELQEGLAKRQVSLASIIDIHESYEGTGNQLIHYACVGFNIINGPNIDLVRLLLDYGANPNAENVVKETPLHCAAKFGTVEICQLLLERGADPTKKNVIGQLPMNMTSNPEMQNVLKPPEVNIQSS